MSEKEKKRGKNSGLGLAIWILAFVIVIIVFLVKWDDIKSNLVKTRFFERLFGKTPSFLVDKNSQNKKDDENSENVIELTKSDEKNSEKITKKDEAKSEENQKAEKKSESQKSETKKNKQKVSENLEKKSNDENKSQSKSDEKESETQKKADSTDASKQIKTVQESKVDTTSKKSESKKSEEKASEAAKKSESKAEEKSEEKKSSENKKTETKTVAQNEKPATVAAKICFVAFDSDGIVVRKEVNRQVAKDSPLTESLNSLLSGPNALEGKTGCKTLIPSGTKLYSAVVKNGTATLDFSEEFEINPNGVQGFLGQLMQIVYTATNFSTVQNVQFLIEGEKKEYLGSEGVWIGSPLSRASFR